VIKQCVVCGKGFQARGPKLSCSKICSTELTYRYDCSYQEIARKKNKRRSESDLTVGQVRKILKYNSATGSFIWLVSLPNGVTAGATAGRVSLGYIRIGIDGRQYLAHRIAYLLMTGLWPKKQIDHVNGAKSDNRWINIRAATVSQNIANSPKRSNNTSGYKGASWNKERQKWAATISMNGKRMYLGRYSKIEDAYMVYVVAAKKYHREFARFR
jgi:hypothetical protein